MNKQELIAYLDEYLNISAYVDDSKNGLQVDSEKTEIRKIGYSVDATTYIFDQAKNQDVDMVLSHHGIFW
jgi:putative NIF3 family GTP cyclohydrolase 1 type 2